MSSVSADPAIASFIAPLVVLVRSQIGVVALLVYEYVITLDQEVALFWKRKKTGATWLFFTTRYLALLTYSFLGSATFASMSDRSCQTLQVIQFSGQTLQYLPWAAFSGLRALAMSGMNWWLASGVFFLALALTAGNIWGLSTGISGSNQPLFGCGGGNVATPQQDLIVTAAQRSCIIAADMIVILLTWRYSWKTRGPSGVRGVRSHLADTLFINGTLYFLVFITLNTIQLAFTLISTIYALDTVGAVIVFTDPLQAVMVSRFMLALQSASGRDALGQDTTFDGHDDTNTTYGEQTLRFASLVVGSIGAQLETSDTGTEEALIQDWNGDADADAGADEDIVSSSARSIVVSGDALERAREASAITAAAADV